MAAARAGFPFYYAGLMKSAQQRTLPLYILIVFMLSAIVLIGNTVNLLNHWPTAGADHPCVAGVNELMSGLIANIAVLAVLILFYFLIRQYFLKVIASEAQLQCAQDQMKENTSERTAQLSALSRHLMQTAEQEKAKLAHELHSEFGACFTVVTMDISVVAAHLGDTDAASTARLQHAIATITELTDLKRRIIANLRPNLLDSLGLSFTLSEYATEFAATSGLAVDTTICDGFDQIDYSCAIALFRVAQEAMNNAARHAGASRIQVILQPKDGGLNLVIADDGRGIAPNAVDKAESHGLAGMRERMMMLAGSLSIRLVQNGHGTEVDAWIPLEVATTD